MEELLSMHVQFKETGYTNDRHILGDPLPRKKKRTYGPNPRRTPRVHILEFLKNSNNEKKGTFRTTLIQKKN